MKRMLALVLAVSLLWLTSCQKEVPLPPPAPEVAEPDFAFTRENFPKLDGSTSTVPLAEAVAAVLLAQDRGEIVDLISFSKTTESYRRLMAGEADLLLAAEPAPGIWKEKEQAKFQWEMEPFAIDGLVFVVNAQNPVDSLTAQQVREIYAGTITNWKQVGGEDVAIVPFQRNAEAGSQTMMEKLVMDGTPLMPAPPEYVATEMAGLMEVVGGYADSTGAMGYSVYYYANDMRMAEGLKILRINDAEPGAQSFRDGSYPFTNPYYAAIAADAPKDDPTRILFDWILGPEGQKLVAHEGYVAVLETEG